MAIVPFVDNTYIYRVIKSKEDNTTPQSDLVHLLSGSRFGQ